MAALLILAPLLLLGTVAGQEQVPEKTCLRLANATEGNFSVDATPQLYAANKTYNVTIKDGRNHTSGYYLLQALSPQNTSVGQWKGLTTVNCSSINTTVQNITVKEAQWIAPDKNLSSVLIRVYLITNNITEVKNLTLNRAAQTTPAPSTTPSSVCRAQSSSWLLAALQLPLLLLVGSLLS